MKTIKQLGALAMLLLLTSSSAWATSESKSEEPMKPHEKEQASTPGDQAGAQPDQTIAPEDTPSKKEAKKEMRKAIKEAVKKARGESINKPNEIPGWGILYIIGGALLILAIVFTFALTLTTFFLALIFWVCGWLAVSVAFVWMLVDLLS